MDTKRQNIPFFLCSPPLATMYRSRVGDPLPTPGTPKGSPVGIKCAVLAARLNTLGTHRALVTQMVSSREGGLKVGKERMLAVTHLCVG